MNKSSIPNHCHISSIPGSAQNEVEESQESGLAAGAVAVCDHPLNCHMWLFVKVSDYLFLGWKCPHIFKRVCWWHMNRFPITMDKTNLLQTQWFFYFL